MLVSVIPVTTLRVFSESLSTSLMMAASFASTHTSAVLPVMKIENVVSTKEGTTEKSKILHN